MSTSSSPPIADRSRLRELEAELDLTQEQLDEKVRKLVEDAERATEKIRNELAELYEAKAKELRSRAVALRSASKASAPSLANSSAREAAITILREVREPTHFSDVARMAVARGYGGGSLKPDDETVQTTFRRTLGKWGDLFKRTAPGTYELADGVKA